MMLARFQPLSPALWRMALCSACLATATVQAGTPAEPPPAPPVTAPVSTPAAAPAATPSATDVPGSGAKPSATSAPVTCCRSTDDFPWQDLPAPGQSLEVEITVASPTYRFHAGDSRFVAFRLPVATAPYRIELRALPTPATDVPGGWRVFYLEAVTLSADHLVSRTAPAENLVLEPVGGELAPQGAYTLFLPVDPAADAEKFLVIHTVPPNEAPEATPQVLQARGAAVRAVSTWQAGASATGRVRISVVTADAPR